MPALIYLRPYVLRYIDRYLQNSVSKSTVRVIKHANFQFFRIKPDNWRQIYKQTSSTFHASKMCLKAGLYDEIFLSQVVKSFFRQFPFNIWYVYTAAKSEWNFSIYNQESISEEKVLTRFLIKIFSSEIHFTNQRSNLYWKWRNDKCEVNTKQEMNENLKTTYETKVEKIRITRQILTRKLESFANE